MNTTVVTPFILGHGRAGSAIWEAFQFLRLQMPQISWSEPVWVDRNASLVPAREGLSIACISNPNGLHAERIVEAHRAGFAAIATEKPACVNEAQAARLREVSTRTAVLHVYRQMWGPQTIKSMLQAGEFGELIAIEGRYWQSSTAERALSGKPVESWKNDPQLSGPSDALLDVGTHWADLAVYLVGELPQHVSGWASYVNAEKPHRETHVHLAMDFARGPRALTSISKTFHGATNHFEINVIGSKSSATWMFLAPDEITIGHGRDRRVMTRKTADLGSKHPPFHGAGWLEGYVEILRKLVEDTCRLPSDGNYPKLRDSVQLIEKLLGANLLARSEHAK